MCGYRLIKEAGGMVNLGYGVAEAVSQWSVNWAHTSVLNRKPMVAKNGMM